MSFDATIVRTCSTAFLVLSSSVDFFVAVPAAAVEAETLVVLEVYILLIAFVQIAGGVWQHVALDCGAWTRRQAEFIISQLDWD